MKPICGPCRKSPKDDECEYSDGPARSRTKALEDTVQRLEARLHELEHPEHTTPSVTLYDPYAPPPPPPQLTISPLFPGSSSSSLPSTPFHQLPRVLSPMNSSPPASQGYSPSSTAASSPPFGTHASLLGISGLASPESTPSILESDVRVESTFIPPTINPLTYSRTFVKDCKLAQLSLFCALLITVLDCKLFTSMHPNSDSSFIGLDSSSRAASAFGRMARCTTTPRRS